MTTNTDPVRQRMAAADPAAVDAEPPSGLLDHAALLDLIIERNGEMERVTSSKRSPVLWRRPVVVAVGFAMLILLVIGVPILLAGGGGGNEAPVAAEPTTPPTTIATEPTTPPTTIATEPTTPPTTIATEPTTPPMVEPWQQVGAEVMSSAIGLYDMTRFGSRLVAIGFDVGEDNARPNGAIFASDDGVAWTRLAEEDPVLNLGAVQIAAVTEGGPGLVAVGRGCEDETQGCTPYATAWTSTDGRSWSRTEHDPVAFGDLVTETTGMNDVLADDEGTLVAVGLLQDWLVDDAGVEQSVTTFPAVWLSSDGVSWERTLIGDGFEQAVDAFLNGLPTTPMQAVARGPDGSFVAVGAMLDMNDKSTAAVWTSIDGSAWDRVDPTSLAFGPGTDMVDVTWGESGFMAVGTVGDSEVGIWQSPDGTAWTRVDTATQPFDSITYLTSVAALDTGYVTVGPHIVETGSLTLWTSPNGENWTRVHVIQTEDSYASKIVVVDGGIALAGGFRPTDGFQAAVWMGPRLDPNTP